MTVKTNQPLDLKLRPPVRTETLADFIHAWTYEDEPVYARAFGGYKLDWGDSSGAKWQAAQKLNLRMAIRSAERLALDDAFIAEIAKKTIAQPPEMLAMTNLAFLPFDKLLVEWNDNVRIRAVAEAAKELGSDYSYDPGIDFGRAGLLLERQKHDNPRAWMLTHVSSSDGSMPVWPYGAAFSLDAEGDIGGYHSDSTKPFIQNLMASGWGYVDDGDNSRVQYAVHDELMARGAAVPEARFFLPMAAGMISGVKATADDAIINNFITTVAEGAAQQSSGKLRWAVAILASLNAVPTVRVKREAKGTFSHAKHSVSRLSTTHVRIDAKPGHEVAVYDKHFHEATGRHNRRHEVRGHWRVIDTRRKRDDYWMCAHVITDEDGLYALCGKCGHLLRWIDHHERGDASLGYVFKDGYDVKG